MDTRLSHVRDMVQKGIENIRSIPTSEMLVNCLTRPLYGPKLRISIENIQLLNVTPSMRTLMAQQNDNYTATEPSFDPEEVMNEDIIL